MIKDSFRRETYRARGDYHRNLNPTWSYYSTYLTKLNLVDNILSNLNREKLILDIGSGEGVFVKKYREQGYKIWGVDYNYGNPMVIPGSVTHLPLATESIDVVLFLDVIEHLLYPDQELALENIYRVLVANGLLILSVPNLAHLMSRLKFLLLGRLGRTSKVSKHPGDRPISEYLALLNKHGFEVTKRRGITLPIPFLTTHLIWRYPQRFLWLHDWLDYIQLPNLMFVNILTCYKRG